MIYDCLIMVLVLALKLTHKITHVLTIPTHHHHSNTDYKHILKILDFKDRIPAIAQIGQPTTGHYYSFWQDNEHFQGIWRCTTLQSYRTPNPKWTTVLDINALKPSTKDTATIWVWHQSSEKVLIPNATNRYRTGH